MNLDEMYRVLVEGENPCEIDPELYTEDTDPLDIIEPAYVNRYGTEYGERVMYWEENYNPSAYRVGENDSPKAKAVIEALVDCGLEFDVDLVKRYPADYK